MLPKMPKPRFLPVPAVAPDRNQTAFDFAVKKFAPESLLCELWIRGAGEHASGEAVAWWSQNGGAQIPQEESEEDDVVSIWFFELLDA